MCGIAGVARASKENSSKSEGLFEAVACLSHRGPDDSGVAHLSSSQAAVSLGHTRLSIIDLSSGGHQPMSSADGRYTMVFNGEIYNYREIKQKLNSEFTFTSDSDTEVLLAAWQKWGVAGLKNLVGMFAFAVFDSFEETLTLVRDAFGIKPLFWSLQNEKIVFASETRALSKLLEKPLTINEDVMTRFLVTGVYDRSDKTFFDRVHRLPGSHYLRVDFSGNQITTHLEQWWVPGVEQNWSGSFDDAASALRELFVESVRLHLRSDVPIGFALSGGIDSSSVAGVARYLEPAIDLHTFSFVSPGMPGDEEQWVDRVNSHIRAIPHKVHLTPGDLAADLDDMIRAQGEPFGSTSIYAQYGVYRLVKQAGVTVTLDGQGADELLAGYHGYLPQRLTSLIEEGKLLKAVKQISAWSKWPGRSRTRALRSLLAHSLSPQLVANLRRRFPMQTGGEAAMWLKSPAGFPLASDRVMAEDLSGRRLVGVLRNELIRGGLDSLLRHGDRNSMRWSIESRVPFLSIPLVDFALGLPEEYLLSPDGRTKHIFRHAMRGIVPEEILSRRDKVGFEAPESFWLSELQSKISDEWLSGLELLPMVDVDKARDGIREQLNGKSSITSQSWRFINAARWAETTLESK